jgi:hypothetical protein
METSVCPESFVIKRVLYVLTGKKQWYRSFFFSSHEKS